jgi:acetoacetate decarboxylase
MGFVKSPEEIALIESALSAPRFVNAQMLSVDFLTDPEVLARLLPPPLRPAATPRVTAMVGRWQSNCCGDFFGGAIYLAARHGEIDGDYVLAMFMDNDTPLVFGRDTFGEPKKLATSNLYRRGDQFYGRVDRGGVRLIELHAVTDVDNGPFEGDVVNFNFKARPAANGIGLEEDAILTRATFAADLWVNLQGVGSVTLRGTVHDPLDELPIVSVLRGAYVEGDLIARCEAVATVPAADFLPYHYGRMDDWSALNSAAAALLPVASRS